MPHDDELVRRFAESSGTRSRAVLAAFTTLLERSWPVPAALAPLRASSASDNHAVTIRRVLDALDAVHASGLPPQLQVGVNDADPRIRWNRQAALYMRDDREVLASGAPRFDILERQDRDSGTVWLRTSKVPYTGVGGDGTVGGFDTISVAEAQRLAKQAQRP